MRRIALLVSLAGALLAAVPAPAAAQAGDDWEVKRDPFDAKVVARYKAILAKNPHDAGALAKLLSMYRRYRTVDKLEDEYKKALDKKPADFAYAPKFRVATVNATEIAVRHKLGSLAAPIVNTAMVGAIVKILNLTRLDSLTEAIAEGVPVKAEANVAAAEEAYGLAERVL